MPSPCRSPRYGRRKINSALSWASMATSRSDPMKILCITFTKAAAANMAARVFDTLAHWIALDDAALDREMRTIGETAIGPAQRARASRLFACALDTPGGLKVQTIHAFCTRLLHQFPFEANVAARFTVLDERAAAELLDRATMGVLLDAAKTPGTLSNAPNMPVPTRLAASTIAQKRNIANSVPRSRRTSSGKTAVRVLSVNISCRPRMTIRNPTV